MKKIVGILAAAAVMASAAFAVDVSSMAQIDGDLFNYSKDGVKALMLKNYDPSGDSDYLWKLSVNGDAAGAEIWSWTRGETSSWANKEFTNGETWSGTYKLAGMWAGTDVVSSVKVWFKPTDWLKVQVGNVGGQSIANPQFGWWAQTANCYSYGYQAEFTVDSFYAKVALEPGAGNYWFDAKAAGINKIGSMWLEGKYSFAYGAIQAIVTRNGTIGAHGYSNWASSPLAMGIAYNNMPYMQTGYYADVIASFKAGDTDGSLAFQGIDSQIGGQYINGALKIQETNLIQYRDAFKYGFETKVSYSIDAYTPYIQIGGYDIMKKATDGSYAGALTIDAGVSTSFGACAVTAWVDVPLSFAEGSSFSFSVPVQFQINL